MELKVILLIIFGVVSVIYLITLGYKPAVFQYILKGLLIPLLLAIYLSSVNIIFWPVVLALVFAWIGDVLLVKITNILWFRLGLASFLIGHICYIAAMHGFINPFNVTILVVSIIAAGGLGIFIYKVVKPGKQMKIPVIAYETVILVMVIFALQLFLSQFIAHGLIFSLLILSGSICFVVSDTLLALRTFRKVKIYFAVMITYIAAQFLITLGFCMV
ncbi:MAG: lysoplasmalogenase [Treponema sp.]|nr:lysoplasmalogenase [Treponema sp.]